MSSPDYHFNVLDETVADEDAFAEQTHQRSADTLFDIITQRQKSISIGLEGKWGSGKSTVIRLLQNRFVKESPEETLFFTFDAWSHSDDPLRRVFLLELIDCLAPDKKPRSKVLNKLHSNISGQKNNTVIKQTSKPTLFGSLLSLSALMVPVGAAFLSKVEYDRLVLWPTRPTESFEWLFGVGLLLGFAPIVCIVAYFLWVRNKKQNISWEFSETTSDEEVQQVISEEREATSVEFQDYFEQILNCGFNECPDRKRIIIVVDNLDRVDREQAKNTWSVLQIFLQLKNPQLASNKNNITDQVWFIVPYDRQGLCKEVSSTEHREVKYEELDALGKTQTELSDSEKDNATDSFIEKCFPVIVEVHQPIISSWLKLCQRYVDKAFICKNDSEEENAFIDNLKKEIIDTFGRYRSSSQLSPTPRKIKAFVNQVGVQLLSWKDEFTVEAVSLYVLMRQDKSIDEIRGNIFNYQFWGAYITKGEEDDLKVELISLLLGVPKKIGVEIFLGKRIKEAVYSEDIELLNHLASEYDEIFWVVWQDIRKDILPTRTHSDGYLLEVTYSICELSKNYKHRMSYEINYLMSVWQGKNDRWDIDEYDYEKPLQSLIFLCADDKVFLHIMSRLVYEGCFSAIKKMHLDDKLRSILIAHQVIKLIALFDKKSSRSEPVNTSIWQWKDKVVKKNEIFFKVPHESAVADELVKYVDNNHYYFKDRRELKIFEIIVGSIPGRQKWDKLPGQLINNIDLADFEGGVFLFVARYLEVLLVLLRYRYEQNIIPIRRFLTMEGFVNSIRHEYEKKNPELMLLYALINKDDVPQKTLNSMLALWDQEAPDVAYNPYYDELKSRNILPF